MSAASDAALGSTLFGGMIASAFVTVFLVSSSLTNNLLFHRMYGVLICQTAWYYRAFPKDPTHLKILVSSFNSRSISPDFVIHRLGFYVSYE